MSDFIAVRVAATQGSAPRDTDAVMRVFADHFDGTIGGGALEWQAIATARAMLAEGQDTMRQTLPLGPNLGQCCGGTVTLNFQRNQKDSRPLAAPLWIWGGGHVGRAIARVMDPFEDRDITVVDTTEDRIPKLPDCVATLVAADPVRAVGHAPKDADHLIVTYSHDIDLGLCDALLRHGFASCGLIGSGTKWARFRKRLASMGHEDAQIARIACPIGDPSLGKHPQAIALGVASTLILSAQTDALGERAG